MVDELVAPDGKWKMDVTKRCFNNEEVRIILSLPLSRFGCQYRII